MLWYGGLDVMEMLDWNVPDVLVAAIKIAQIQENL